MVVLGVLQVLFRKTMNYSLPFSDNVIMMLVFYIAIFGAISATLSHKHINIEIVSKFLSEKSNQYLAIIANIVSFLVIILLITGINEYLNFQKESNEIFLFNISYYEAEWLTLPAFLLIALSFLLNTLELIILLVKKGK
jgi:TRAP-type C4-dicarboxylate transport system permease small subunit